MKLINNNSGTVLLYSLLIISLITAIAITVSIVVINELKLTSGAADATMAYYAAESGIERGLYTLKNMRSDGSSTLSDAVAEIGSFPKGGETAFDNSADYSDEQTKSKTSEIVDEEVKENQYIQADYYNVEDPLSFSGIVTAVVKNGPDYPESNPNPDTWAEVSWTAWDENGVLGTSTSARKVIGPTDLQPDPPADIGWPITLDVFSTHSITPVGYRLRIKALFGDLSSLTMTPYDGGNQPVTNLPSQIEIKSVGERGNFKQSLTATVPWEVPLSGLYDYVLFSEGDILKTIILSRAAYSSGVIEVEADNITNGQCTGCGGAGTCSEDGWLATGCSAAVTCDIVSGSTSFCSIFAEDDAFTLPIPDTVPEGDEYYLSLRSQYICTAGDCDGREVAVEISEQSSIINDQAAEQSSGGAPIWKTCTVPESFSLGDPSLPEDDLFRTVKFTAHGSGWDVGENVDLDWYQLSTYKIFEDCE